MTKSRRLTRFLVAGVVAVPLTLLGLTGCTSGGAGTIGGSPIPFEQFGKVTAQKLCGAIQSCCSQSGFTDELQACDESAAAALQANVEEEQRKYPDLRYDAQKAGNCVASVVAAYATCNPKGAEQVFSPDCADYLRGTKPLGAACTTSVECAASGAGDVRCSYQSATTRTDGGTSPSTGRCTAVKKAAEGDPCRGYRVDDSLAAECDAVAGLYCEQASGTCKKRGSAGDVCITTTSGGSLFAGWDACAKGLTCDYESKQCVALPGPGEACQAGYNCAESAYCDRATGKCAAKRAAGEACDASQSSGADECLHGCDRKSKKCRPNEVPRDLCAGELV